MQLPGLLFIIMLNFFCYTSAAHQAEKRHENPYLAKLHDAIEADDLDTITHLIKENLVTIDEKNSAGETPLMYALHHGSEETMQLLMDEGADLEAQDNNGMTVLQSAARQGFHHDVALLLQNGAKMTPDFWQTVNVLPDEIKTSVQAAVDAALKKTMQEDPLNELDRKLQAAARHEKLNKQLLDAASKNDTALMKKLLDDGADIEAINVLDQNALMVAASKRNLAAVTFLSLYADDTTKKNLAHATDIYGMTALMTAVLPEVNPPVPTKQDKIDQWQIVRLLIQSFHSDINAQSPVGFTPLMMALNIGNKAIALLLIAARPLLDVQNIYGATALMIAAKEDYTRRDPTKYPNEDLGYDTQILDLLLQNGANPSIKDREGYVARDYAVNQINKDLILAGERQLANPEGARVQRFLKHHSAPHPNQG